MSAQTLLAFFAERSAAALEMARTLVNMESPTAAKAHVDALGAFVADQFRVRGAVVETIPQTVSGHHLRIGLVTAAEAVEPERGLILGHLDTVWTLGEVARRPFRIEDGKAYGMGLFDMKMSLALLLMMREALNAGHWRPRRAITVLLNSDEEDGSHTSRARIEEEARRSRYVLVLEPPLPGYRVKTMRKGIGRFQVMARGRAAHAGVDHEKGINAIEELAHQIIALQRLTDYARGITVNVGVASGGTVSNVVPEAARADVDVRVATMEDGEEVTRRILGLKPTHPGAALEITGGMNRPPLVRTSAIAQLYETARALAAEIGLTLGEGATGGGSDGCFTAALGIPTLDGLGVDGLGAHAVNEHIIIDDIPRKAALLSRIIETF